MAKLELVSTNTKMPPSIKPPRPLGPHGQGLWDRILSENSFDDHAGQEYLAQVCAALDTAEACAARVAEDGPMIRVNNIPKEHPCLRAELSARNFVTRGLSRLGLVDEPTKPVGRPPMKGFQGNG